MAQHEFTRIPISLGHGPNLQEPVLAQRNTRIKLRQANTNDIKIFYLIIQQT